MTPSKAPSSEQARGLDQEDPLRRFREEFSLPKAADGSPLVYLCGNSLGLQPKRAREAVIQELDDWANLGIEGYGKARSPWMDYPVGMLDRMAAVVGALPSETVIMNHLTVNLHLMMTSFYRPTKERFKILLEAGAFPADRYAIISQAVHRGLDPDGVMIEVAPRPGNRCIDPQDILETIEREGHSIALVLLGGVNYLTGQFFDLEEITQVAHAQGCKVGFDLAHAVGNVPLRLHDWKTDFAVWCNYKYLNGGPGAVAGAFVHEQHHGKSLKELPRLVGWWSNALTTRFQMAPDFDPAPGALSWQLSNSPVLQRAALAASLELFEKAGVGAIREKSVRLTAYLQECIERIPGSPFKIVSPKDTDARGAQLSLSIPRTAGGAREFHTRLRAAGVVGDAREPDIVRLSPAPLYNSFEDCARAAEALASLA